MIFLNLRWGRLEAEFSGAVFPDSYVRSWVQSPALEPSKDMFASLSPFSTKLQRSFIRCGSLCLCSQRSG